MTLSLSGCSWSDTLRQFRTIDRAAVLEGRIDGLAPRATTYVVLFDTGNGDPKMAQRHAVDSDGRYRFYVLPGRYYLGAFTDLNNDAIYQTDEPAAYIPDDDGNPRGLAVDAGAETTLEPIDVSNPIALSERPDDTVDVGKLEPTLGQVTTLDHRRFSRKNARLGFSKPLSHIEDNTGGLMFLEELDPDRIPVLFVHGVKGTARDFRKLIASLDRTRYQMWVFQYPSGLPLKPTTNYLLKALRELHKRHQFRELMIVAHSMGGLIARHVVQESADGAGQYNIPVTVTVNSPLLGLNNAADGVRYSPVVVPVWRDLAPDGSFIAGLHDRDWPKSTEYTLIASFLRGRADDGVIPFASQVSLALQEEATHFYVFEDEHTAILSNDDLAEKIGMALGRP